MPALTRPRVERTPVSGVWRPVSGVYGDPMSFDVPDPGLTPDQMVARAVALRSHLRRRTGEDRGPQSLLRRDAEAVHRRRLLPHPATANVRWIRVRHLAPSTERSSRSPEVARPAAGCCASVPATRCNSVRRSRSRRRRRVFGPDGHFIAPLSVGNSPGARPAKPVDGGYLVSGKWRYASGVPYSTDFMGLADVEGTDPPEPIVVIVPREQLRGARGLGRTDRVEGIRIEQRRHRRRVRACASHGADWPTSWASRR